VSRPPVDSLSTVSTRGQAREACASIFVEMIASKRRGDSGGGMKSPPADLLFSSGVVDLVLPEPLPRGNHCVTGPGGQHPREALWSS